MNTLLKTDVFDVWLNGLKDRTGKALILRRIEQAGGQLISKTQLYCELQRDWAREATVPGFMDVFESWDGFNPEKAFKG